MRHVGKQLAPARASPGTRLSGSRRLMYAHGPGITHVGQHVSVMNTRPFRPGRTCGQQVPQPSPFLPPGPLSAWSSVPSSLRADTVSSRDRVSQEAARGGVCGPGLPSFKTRIRAYGSPRTLAEVGLVPGGGRGRPDREGYFVDGVVKLQRVTVSKHPTDGSI